MIIKNTAGIFADTTNNYIIMNKNKILIWGYYKITPGSSNLLSQIDNEKKYEVFIVRNLKEKLYYFTIDAAKVG